MCTCIIESNKRIDGDMKKVLKRHQGTIVSECWGPLLRWTHWVPLPLSASHISPMSVVYVLFILSIVRRCGVVMCAHSS